MKKGPIAGRSIAAVTAALLLVVSLGAPSGAYPRPGETTRIYDHEDVSSTGVLFEDPLVCGKQHMVDISDDGRFTAFASQARNLPHNSPQPQRCDVFVFDRISGDIRPVGTTGVTGEPVVATKAGNPSLSATGRFVAFESNAANLVAGKTNACLRPESGGLVPAPCMDIYVFDARTRDVERVSLELDGSERPGDSYHPTISLDGRYVVYESATTVFMFDRRTRKTKLVSVTPEDEATFGIQPHLGQDGRWVAFFGDSTNLSQQDAAECGGQSGDTFLLLRDMKEERTEVISRTSDGACAPALANVGIGGRLMSADARVFTFTGAGAENSNNRAWVPNDSNLRADIIVRDRRSERTQRVSVSSAGQEARQGWSYRTSISPDGRWVVFDSGSDDLSEGAEPSESLTVPIAGQDMDVYVHDLNTGATEWISVRPSGQESSGCTNPEQTNAAAGAISRGGRYAAFWNCSDDLVPGNEFRGWDLFLRNRGDALGAFHFGGSPSSHTDPAGDICIDAVCLPPGAAVTSSDDVDDLDELLTQKGANLYGASLAYRPDLGDLFAVIELEHMPRVIPGASPVFYGLRFKVEEKNYEVRATSLMGGTFGLFDCTDSPVCRKVADLRGGYGTTGERVVFSLPLDAIGLETVGRLKDVEAFSSIGSYLTGMAKVLDRVRLR